MLGAGRFFFVRRHIGVGQACMAVAYFFLVAIEPGIARMLLASSQKPMNP